MSNTTKCPQCGNTHLQVSIQQWIDVVFTEDDHEVTDGPVGDLLWEDGSHVICATNFDGCGWAGKMSECEARTRSADWPQTRYELPRYLVAYRHVSVLSSQSDT